MDLRNRQVQFRVCDIYLPDPVTVLSELYEDSVLEGRVLDLTESEDGKRFAVVKVDSLDKPVVIAVGRIARVI